MLLEEELTYKIRKCIFTVYNYYGPGLLESVYEAALVQELRNIGLNVKSQISLPFIHGSVKLKAGYRLDILVEDKVIIEVKAVEKLLLVHHKQLVTYLKLTGYQVGILVNFNCNDILSSIIRKIHTF